MPTQVRIKPEPIPITVPIDVIGQTQTFDPDNDDAIMEDAPAVQAKAKATKKPRVPYASEISKAVDSNAILQRALNAPITVSVKEIMGVSKELSSLMQDALRYRKPAQDAANFAGNAIYQHTHIPAPKSPQGILIRVPMEIDGQSIQAIIDTGSTLNIMHHNFAKMLRRPINRS